jgi:hypothetical protein
MPVDIESYFNSAVDSVNSGMLSGVFGNSLYVSLLISCLVFVVVWAVYAEDRKFKTFFYIFIMIFPALLVHHHILTNRIKRSSEDDMVAGISGGLDELQPLEMVPQ